MAMDAAPRLARLAREWWEDGGGFFGQKYMEGDDSLIGFTTTPRELEERTTREVEGVVRLTKLEPGSAVMDCPCGYGRHTIGLAKIGMRPTGVDINSEHLAAAEKRVTELTTIRLLRRDMRLLDFQGEFDAVINMFFSFGFFDLEEDNMRVLKNFYDALKPGGRFLMHTDVNIGRIVKGDYKLHEKRPLKSGRVLEINETYNQKTRRLDGTWTLHQPDGSSDELAPYSVRVFTYEEFAGWCREIGFSATEAYGEWDGSPLTDDSEEMMIVATR